MNKKIKRKATKEELLQIIQTLSNLLKSYSKLKNKTK